MCISVYHFYMKIINKKLLYNSIQQYTEYNDTTACVNWPMKKNLYKSIRFFYENYQQQAYAVV